MHRQLVVRHLHMYQQRKQGLAQLHGPFNRLNTI